jgi:hypothetical protein
MATQFAFGKIVTDGLILALDAADRNSYPGSGNDWTDLSINANNSILINGPTFNSNNGGNIVFDGTNDALRFNPSSSLTGLGAITANMWLNIKDAGAVLFYKSDNNTSRGWFIEYGDNVAGSGQTGFGFAAVSNGSNLRYYINKNQLSTGSWTNYTVTWDGVYPNTSGTGVKIYVNGIQNTTTTYTAVGTGTHLPDTSADPLAFGESDPTGTSNADYYSGSVGVISLYNRDLTAAEVLQNYNAQKSRFNL